MNKFIKEQLQKITIPMTTWDENTTKIVFSRQTIQQTVKSDFEVGGVYNIEVENYILNPPPTFTLAANWNNGTNPPEKEMFAEVLQFAGKMIKFNCKGKTTGIEWVGWLPRKSITMR